MRSARAALAALLIVPPAVNAALHLINPLTGGSDAKLIDQAVAHPTATAVMQLQYILLLFAPAAVVIAHRTRHARALSWVGGVVLCTAGLAAFAGPIQYTMLDVIAHSPNPHGMLSPARALGDAKAFGVLSAIFVVGQLIGFVLLGAAMVRSGAVARWSGWVVIAAAVANVVAHSVPSQLAVALAWALLAVGLGGCALTGPRMSAPSTLRTGDYAQAA